ncbi:hypothetical protein ACQP2T_28465 [Nonomuraea sp. CA-143628]|uniref:hypothetical protein n=1 Tax=Nonomuraea sp. CA-143628 TaxID=3239997 RepID=UPI003D91998B
MIGPGQHSVNTQTFRLTELDASADTISRKHGVALTGGDLARPRSAPATRPELGVFKPNRQAAAETFVTDLGAQEKGDDTFTDAMTITASGTSFGDYSGRLKSATVTYGTQAPARECSPGRERVVIGTGCDASITYRGGPRLRHAVSRS